jgi:Ala-tRNA(Pro) deacylase
MTIANSVVEYLQKNYVSYSVVGHPHSSNTRQTTDAAHVPPEKVAKAVILKDTKGYLMAVVAGDKYVDVRALSARLRRPLEVAQESTIAAVFRDCEPGAIPPLGPAYNMETIVDNGLVGQADIYFEGGDHEELVHLDGESFLRLLKDAKHAEFSH